MAIEGKLFEVSFVGENGSVFAYNDGPTAVEALQKELARLCADIVTGHTIEVHEVGEGLSFWGEPGHLVRINGTHSKGYPYGAGL